MTYPKELITGTLVNYFVTCKREAWLYSRKIVADQYEDNMSVGRALAQIKEEQNPFPFSHLQFDRIEKRRGHYLVTEYKKTLKNPEAAKSQLLFYMYLLKSALNLKLIRGKIQSGRTSYAVEADDKALKEMDDLLEEISTYVTCDKVPKPILCQWCKGCAYKDYCF